ncbi:MAG: hypothetical protein ACKO58_05585 [Cyanobium sp.]
MKYVIAALIAFVVIYHLWPFLLLAAVCCGGFLWYKQLSRDQNIKTISAIMPAIREDLSSLYFIDSGNRTTFGRLTDLQIVGRDKTILDGKDCLEIELETVKGNTSLRENSCNDYQTSLSKHEAMIIDSFPSDYSTGRLWSAITSVISDQGYEFLPAESFDAKICAIIFSNYPEAEWADQALMKIDECIAPLENAYNVSLRNELLSNNSDILRRSLDVLERERREISAYMTEALQSIQKCAEYLSIPKNLRSFSEYDISTLDLASKRNHIREAFEEVLAIKSEYDQLSV